MDVTHWLSLSDEELAAEDLAAMNLEAATDLPGPGCLDAGVSLTRVREWTEILGIAIRNAVRNRSRYTSFDDMSDAEFRVAMFVTVLQRDLGVEYHAPFAHGAYDARDSRNLFIHGPLTGFGGTCASLPFLYAALLRRLGYPVNLVQTKGHNFCRWEDDRDRFNIEATSRGFVSHPDGKYLEWPFTVSREEVQQNGYLQSLSPREELAECLSMRAQCLMDNLRSAEAVVCAYHAAKCAPRKLALKHEWARATMTHHVMEHCKRSARERGVIEVRPPLMRNAPERVFGVEAVRNVRRILENRGARLI